MKSPSKCSVCNIELGGISGQIRGIPYCLKHYKEELDKKKGGRTSKSLKK